MYRQNSFGPQAPIHTGSSGKVRAAAPWNLLIWARRRSPAFAPRVFGGSTVPGPKLNMNCTWISQVHDHFLWNWHQRYNLWKNSSAAMIASCRHVARVTFASPVTALTMRSMLTESPHTAETLLINILKC